MIRYDVLWHDLVRRLNEARMYYASNAQELEKMNAKDYANCNRHVSEFIGQMLKKTQKEFDCMREKDEEAQYNANVTLQEILQELKKLNKGKEEEEDGEHGRIDGDGSGAGRESSGEQEDHVQ